MAVYVYKAGAQAEPGQSQAVIDGFGLAWGLTKPEPPQAKPKPGLSGQAGPEQHYIDVVWVQAVEFKFTKNEKKNEAEDDQFVQVMEGFNFSKWNSKWDQNEPKMSQKWLQ